MYLLDNTNFQGFSYPLTQVIPTLIEIKSVKIYVTFITLFDVLIAKTSYRLMKVSNP